MKTSTLKLSGPLQKRDAALSRLRTWAKAFILVAVVTLLCASTANATTYYSRATGTWDNTNTWSLTSGGAVAGAGVFPGTVDDVIIEGGFAVTVSGSQACTSVQIGSLAATPAGTLNFSGATPSLTVSGAVKLGAAGATSRDGTVTFTSDSTLTAASLEIGGTGAGAGQGVVTMTAGGTLSIGSITVNTGGGTFTQGSGTGTVELTADNTLPATVFLTFRNLKITSGTTTLGANTTVTGVLTVGAAGELYASSVTLTLNGSGAPFVVTGTFTPATSTVSYTSTSGATVAGTTYNNLDIAGSNDTFPLNGTATVNANLTIASGETLADAGFTLTVKGNVSNSGTHSGAGKILLAGTSAQTLAGTFGNVELNNAVGASLSAATTINGTLTATTGTFTAGAFTLTVFGATTVASTLAITSGTGAKSFADVTVNGTWNNSGNAAVTISGNLTKGGGGTFTAGTGAYTLSGSGKIISGTLSIPSLTITIGSKAISGALTVSTTLTLTSGGLTGASNLTLGNGATISRAAGSLDTVPTFPVAGTVNVTYTAGTLTTGPEMPTDAAKLNNLTVSGGTTTLSAAVQANGFVNLAGGTLNTSAVGNYALTVVGDLAVGSGTLTANASTITIGGNFTGTGGFTTSGTSGPGTVVLNGTGTQTLPTTGLGIFNNLTINKSSGSATLTGVTAVNKDLTITAGTLDVVAGGNTLSVGGNWINNGTFTPSTSTVTFNGTAGTQTISGSTATTFNSVTISSPAYVVATANLSVSGTMNVASGATFDSGARVVSGAGSFTLSAGGTLGVGDPNGITTTATGTGASAGSIRTTTRTFTAAASYIYDGTLAQVTGNGLPTGAGGIVNLTITNSAGVTLDGNASLTAAGTLRLSTGALSYGGNTLTLASGTTISRDTGTLASAPTFTTTVNVTYTGSVAVTTGPEIPTSTTDLGNLIINKSGGVTLGANVNVKTTGTLTLTSGILTTTGSFQVNVLNTGNSSVTINPGSYVNGTIQKSFATGNSQAFTFPVGDASSYAPVAFASMNVTTTPGTVSAKTTTGDHPGISTNGLDSTKSVNRYWTLTGGGGINITANTATFTFVNPGDLDAGADPLAFVVRRYTGATWTTTTIGTRTSTTSPITSATALGDFAIGEQLINNYLVAATSPQSPGATFTTTVTARDILGQTVVADSTTVITMGSSTGNVQYDSNGNGLFGDNTKPLTSGVLTINTRDFTSETVNLTATDGTSSGTLSSLVIGDQNGDYRTRSNGGGAWNGATTWQTFSGGAWGNTGTAPTASSGVVTILTGDIVTVTAAGATADQIVVQAGAQLTINSGITFVVAAGAGTDLDVFGTVNNAGTMTMTGTGVVQSGGKYQHNFTTTTGVIPTATWASDSTCEIIGYTTTTSAAGLNLGQSFGNFTWNCPSQTGNFQLAGGLATVNGNLTVVTNGTGTLRLTTSTTFTLAIAGNLNIQGGTLEGATTTGNPTINVAGDLALTGGTLDMGNGGTAGTETINVSGNVSVASGATLKKTTAAQTGNINFAKSGTQTFTNGGTITATSVIGWTVNNGSTVDLGTSVLSGSGTFTLSGGGGLISAHANGLNGNITVTGTKSFGTTGNFTYNGSVAQVTGSLLPATVNNLTIANSAGVTLNSTVAISGTGTVNAGALLLGTGTLNGPVTINGTVAPGSSIGTLTFGSAPTLAGTALMEINRASGPNADKIAGGAALGGTLTVVNTGAALEVGDSFDLFDGTLTENFAATNLPHGPVHWTTTGIGAGGNGTITFTNNTPTARAVTNTVNQFSAVTVTNNPGKHPIATDADGDTLTYAVLIQPTNGSAVATASGIIYTNTAGITNVFDTLTYTVSDGVGGVATSTMAFWIQSQLGFNLISATAEGGFAYLTYLGIPGQTYVSERCTNLVTLNWEPVATNTAQTVSDPYPGRVFFTNAIVPPASFFRTQP